MVMMVADTYLPVSLSVPEITDAQFQELCEEYGDYLLEYTSEGEVLILPPTDPETGARNAILTEELSRWSRAQGAGIVTDSSAGFILPNGARRAPDAAWVSRERFRQGRAMCPDFVIELISPTDRPKKVHEKMLEWVANGAALGWLIDPGSQSVTIYRPNQELDVRAGISTLEGEGPVAGFTLDLQPIWNVAG